MLSRYYLALNLLCQQLYLLKKTNCKAKSSEIFDLMTRAGQVDLI